MRIIGLIFLECVMEHKLDQRYSLFAVEQDSRDYSEIDFVGKEHRKGSQ